MSINNPPYGWPNFPRGTTIQFSTTFFDFSGNVVQPNAATVAIAFDPNADEAAVTLPMVAPTGPAVVWTAQWDTRNLDPGAVYWSIHSSAPVPVAVEDGRLTLTANLANLPTF